MQMGIERSGGGGRGEERNNESRKSKRRQRRSSPVQRLYDTCNEVFADCGPGIVPSPDKVQKLASFLDQSYPAKCIGCSISKPKIDPFCRLDGMTQEDVGLRPNMQFFSSERAPTITYLHIHECDKFSIGIFCLPPTSVIPLHNHPGMTVFSKLLFGTMHIKAYDWWNEVDYNASTNANAPNNQPDGLCLAKLKVNSEFTAPCGTSILYPADGGNIHRFTAKTACAFLDVLGPPYCDPDGRHCQYYYEFPFSNFPELASVGDEEKDGIAWLKERENPQDLAVVGVSYNGPKIVVKK